EGDDRARAGDEAVALLAVAGVEGTGHVEATEPLGRDEVHEELVGVRDEDRAGLAAAPAAALAAPALALADLAVVLLPGDLLPDLLLDQLDELLLQVDHEV